MSVTGSILGFVLVLLSATPTDNSAVDRELLAIESSGASHIFEIELAVTAREQARGLMYRKQMAEHRGMFFPFKSPRRTSFYMKNTYIPLDIIFVDQDGVIFRIAAMTEPLTEVSHLSGEEAAAVLEINGGLSQELGISPGDIVRHAHFSNLKACAGESDQMPCIK